VPTEADEAYFKHYSLLLHLGWNTMIEEDYGKLRNYVRDGGTLLIGLPQFSRHVKRDFLLGMDDLALWNDGDLSELCGVKVHGKGEVFSGTWNCADRMSWPEAGLSAIPSSSSEEDGECHLAEIGLAGGEVMVWDAFTNRPLIVRHTFGKGTVYLLTAYAYPGHEKLQKFMASLIAKLASENLPECHVEDPSREVFWNQWNEPDQVRRLMLLNTDWTGKGNRKTVKICTPVLDFETEVVEREPKILTILDRAVLEPDADLHIEVVSPEKVRIHGTGQGGVTIRRPDGTCETLTLIFDTTTVKELEIDSVSRH